jgi:hypothetical protein
LLADITAVIREVAQTPGMTVPIAEQIVQERMRGITPQVLETVCRCGDASVHQMRLSPARSWRRSCRIMCHCTLWHIPDFMRKWAIGLSEKRPVIVACQRLILVACGGLSTA